MRAFFDGSFDMPSEQAESIVNRAEKILGYIDALAAAGWTDIVYVCSRDQIRAIPPGGDQGVYITEISKAGIVVDYESKPFTEQDFRTMQDAGAAAQRGRRRDTPPRSE